MNNIKQHEFGGSWTEKKLQTLQSYLKAYRIIFTKNPQARHFTTWYVDAFAGTGTRSNSDNPDNQLFFDVFSDDEMKSVKEVFEGSVKKSLDLEFPFDNYLFIESKKKHAQELEKVVEPYRAKIKKNIHVVQGEANEKIQNWLKNDFNQKTDRAVVFLDPYGMQVEWETIEMLGKTKAVDLWLLFPAGIGILRMMKKDGNIPEKWQETITKVLGTTEWKDKFYTQSFSQIDLFGQHQEETVCNANVEKIGAFFLERLKKAFHSVSDKTLVLKNTNNFPLYLFVFAAANERGSKPAMRITNSILGD